MKCPKCNNDMWSRDFGTLYECDSCGYKLFPESKGESKVKIKDILNSVICGDCVEVMKTFPDNSVDAIVTDPPYALGFMGKDWDTIKQYQDFSYKWGVEALRVLKLGGYLLAFSGTRTYHRMVCGLEDAGFEIRDQVDWLYGSGFPKSYDISQGIDKKFLRDKLTEELGRKPTNKEFKSAWKDYRKIVGKSTNKICLGNLGKAGYKDEWNITVPTTDLSKKWDGWGTGLKPAHEPIVLAQKSKEGTFVDNVLKYGTGGLNIDGCKIGTEKRYSSAASNPTDRPTVAFGAIPNPTQYRGKKVKGRFPSNLILDPVSAKMIDRQSGISDGGKFRKGSIRTIKKENNLYRLGFLNGKSEGEAPDTYGDSGGASRFFYCAKASKGERNAGLEKLTGKDGGSYQFRQNGSLDGKIPKDVKNDIATLKPINLMRYLVRLVTPPNGIVLDPFAGSGTTGIACVIQGFNYILIEKRERFANLIAPKRIEYWSNKDNWSKLKEHPELKEVNK